MPQADVSPGAIMQLGLGFWASKALLSAVELGLFSLLAKGALDADAIGTKLGLHRRSLFDFLDALVALDMLDRHDGIYSNTPATALFLDHDKPSYIGGILEMANARLYPFWANLTEGLRTGEPQNEARTGGDLFDAIYTDSDTLANFVAAMTGLSLGTGRAIARKFPWQDYKSFVDIGTAQGGVPAAIARAHPHLRGVGFDLPAVGPHFDAFMRRNGVADRVSFAGGDFFADPLPSADVVIMGHILHDWGLEQKRQLIAKAYDALPPGGAFLVFEPVIDNERRKNALGLLTSLNMLIETRGGFDYTFADCMGWMRDAGFRQTRSEPLVGPDSMVIGIK
ncbi:MAG: methyltransferase [Hyphomicrobiales bacterium]|nr:MAG: methyltransferase [Hyphomicrobiales bacterium]